MTEKPGNFAVPPEPLIRSEHGGQDALSDVLQSIHLRGGEVVRSYDTTARYPSGARLVHLVEHGTVRVELPDGPVELAEGDMALLARGDAHTVRGGTKASWFTGEYLTEPVAAAPLLGVLPGAIVVRGALEDARWLPLGLALMITEVNEPRPGSRVMVSRLLDLLFIQALRLWSDSGQKTEPGWLRGALDPSLSAVVSAIHLAPGRDWQVDELARIAALSRSAFATRFTEVLGRSPGAYVLRQRLEHAARLLLTTTEQVGRIAAGVGYSEAAFSRAFTRAYGSSPRAWRASVRARGEAPTSAPT
ncbi:AraC family transcriptional regulator [Lentzea flaviverrucosa]|uniref:AraC-type DNA-binding protein n=1 Tax=Lentzea flaviverrucosa TaxID=200379 RepID=A0A1H9UY24_9PSEU|nr:AraC family transcriptional regulator [Lentzea flaviverrucosa]RDI27683.1 AraC family transcriptional regulator [Lentzea flaviverrucosa]SES13957.1 AraC-type DNA-binding protein [Lentzea flaviverrucosa]